MISLRAHDMAQLCLQCPNAGAVPRRPSRSDERYRAADGTAWAASSTASPGVTVRLFVEMTDSVSGLCMTQLPNDWYRFDPVRKMLSGEHRRGLAAG